MYYIVNILLKKKKKKKDEEGLLFYKCFPLQFRQGIFDDGFGDRIEVTERQCSANLIREEPEFSCDSGLAVEGVEVVSSYCCSEDLCNWQNIVERKYCCMQLS